jgi:hypothetical protein
MIMFLFVYTFIFWIYLPHVRENMWSSFFWTWLTLLGVIIPSSIHLSANDVISFFFVAE